MTRIVASDGWSYELTPEDEIVLAVAAEYEGGDDPADVWWTYAQRLALRGFRGRTMSSLVMAHSQPVNPIWRRTGEKCREGGSFYGTSHCNEAALRRREEAAAKLRAGMTAVAPRVRERFAAWKGGLPKRVGKAVDFADPTVAQRFVDTHDGSAVMLRAGNWFVATPESLSWPANFVALEQSSGITWAGLLLGLGVGYAAWRFR